MRPSVKNIFCSSAMSKKATARSNNHESTGLDHTALTLSRTPISATGDANVGNSLGGPGLAKLIEAWPDCCLLYTSDAADDLLCVDLGGRRIIKKKKKQTENNVQYDIHIH